MVPVGATNRDQRAGYINNTLQIFSSFSPTPDAALYIDALLLFAVARARHRAAPAPDAARRPCRRPAPPVAARSPAGASPEPRAEVAAATGFLRKAVPFFRKP